MSVVIRYSPSNLTKEKYDEVNGRLDDESWPPDGLDMHVSFGSDGDLRVSEIWDSEEQWRTFAEKLMPALSEAGIEMSGDPEVYEVHELQKR